MDKRARWTCRSHPYAGHRYPPEIISFATRAFKQTFNLADHVKVVGAGLENGLLTVELRREVPEALKPRRIKIMGSDAPQPIAQDNQQQLVDAQAA